MWRFLNIRSICRVTAHSTILQEKWSEKSLLLAKDIIFIFSKAGLVMKTKNTERTFIMVKPDGVQRRLIYKIIKRFEIKGFKLVAMKLMWASESLLANHYKHLAKLRFYPELIKYMNSGPVVPMVWEGLNVVKAGRQILGTTNPQDSERGSIRGDLCIQVGRNIVHGSDSPDSAKTEIELWFTPQELLDWTPAIESWVYED